MSTHPPGEPSDQSHSHPLQEPGTGPVSWGRRTNPLSRPVTAELPDLSRYSDAPRYDMATIVQLVGVRAVTIWSWEQNLGIGSHDGGAEAVGNMRYSERHLIALSWLRDQIVAGADPNVAARRLREALAIARGMPPSPTPSGVPPMFMPSRGPLSRPLRPEDNPPSQPISHPSTIWPAEQESMSPSRPLGEGGRVAGQPRIDATPRRNLGDFNQRLFHAFSLLDTASVTRVLDEVFAIHSIETTCVSLLLPVLARINEIWVRKDTAQPEALFAHNMLKARLFRLFDMTGERPDAPLAFIASGPNEPFEIDALILALFWRRAGMRVVNFGLRVDGPSLVEKVGRHRPNVVALTVTSQTRMRSVNRFIRDVERRVDLPRLILCVVGPLLSQQFDIIQKTNAVHLGAGPLQATHQVQQLLRIHQSRT